MVETNTSRLNMDQINLIELKSYDLQKDMNELIVRGDSPVQKFYSGSVIFITGSSGFLGKQLLEKLLRACDIKKVFLLIRAKKGKTIQERLDHVLKDVLYDPLRRSNPKFAEKLIPVEGDVADIRLGLSDKNWERLTKEVDTVFHMAATIRFDEPIRVATLTNVRGTRETLALAKACPKLKNFVYVSTAFTHATYERINQPVLEQFYPCPIPPDTIIKMAESMEDSRLDGITMDLIKGWPNTYTFTKAIAEEVIRTTATELPICIVRPPIVVPAYYEPLPGWHDMSALQGPSGIVAGIIMGVMHVFFVDEYCKLPMTPVDIVNNATIAAGWDAFRRRRDGKTDIPIYTVSNKDQFMTWNFIGVILREGRFIYPSPKAIWFCYMIEVTSKTLYAFLSLFLHYIPAYLMDGVCSIMGVKMPKGVTSFVGIYRKVDKFTQIFDYFLAHSWGFVDANVQEMVQHMDKADRAIFLCNLRELDFQQFVKIWGAGVRRYIMKDGLKDSEKAVKKQKIFFVCHIIFIAAYVVLVWSFFKIGWSLISALLSYLF